MIKIHFLISNVYASNSTLRCEQHVAHELPSDCACTERIPLSPPHPSSVSSITTAILTILSTVKSRNYKHVMYKDTG